jgi:hypothetical protein
MYMVVKAFSVDIDLVTEDYYAREIAYEAKMVQKSNLKALGARVEISRYQNDLVVEFPEELSDVDGEIHFYHISRELFDKKIPIQLDEQNRQVINRKLIVAGRYRVYFTWDSDGKSYFQQERLFIQ